ncbi:P-loop containing nucleoside triphosphate hydrolase protein [Crepidotus variabilis]|uniref:P-loop containing nucleoside triphosphate hydrolase protein n=1 Tax=Crepidotus variabilis TaxID=179855 RepID=A0A9P6EJD0_9AGAR|nr:P-loop containing nucleoside triphosphate hydrolase protein [Crepidotus variabilis]
MTNSNEIIIAIMGPTGSGKSNIIDMLSNGHTHWSGSTLKSVTTKVRSTTAKIPIGSGEQKITLVDTPGFDDTTKSDTEILEMIAEWMADTHRKKTELTGIMYLHRITDNRLAGTPHRNLKMFGKLCGDGPNVGKKVMFVTTMWDKLQGDSAKLRMGQKRQGELKQYWDPMMKLGAQTAEFNNTREAAIELASRIIRQEAAGGVTLLQEELVDLNRPLNETQAAQTLYSQFQTLLAQHRATLVDLERAAKGANDASMVADLNAECYDQRYLIKR